MSEIWGFIGAGNMGGALIRAAAKVLPAGSIRIADRDTQKAEALAAEVAAQTAENAAIARDADFVVLGVKPQMLADMLGGIRGTLAARQKPVTLVSMAAGVPIAAIRSMAGDLPVIRIMPNMPVAAGEGMILYTAGADVPAERVERFKTVFSAAGRLDELPERLIDAGCALSGCGPAFVCLMAEAMADAGVACGLPRDKALLLAEQTLKGTAAQLLLTGTHPGMLKDAVCSPAGSTIAGVRVLEQQGLRGAVTDAVVAAYDRTRELGK